jgi:lactate dehydrogenase-like 2-hydroxyacid dehydrogenase
MNDREISKNMSRSPSNHNSLTIQQYDLFQNGYKQPDYDRRISFDKVLVIGLGQLGLPVAKYVKDRGFDVYGYDISTKALESQIDEDYKKYRQTKETGLCKYAASAAKTICQKC